MQNHIRRMGSVQAAQANHVPQVRRVCEPDATRHAGRLHTLQRERTMAGKPIPKPQNMMTQASVDKLDAIVGHLREEPRLIEVHGYTLESYVDAMRNTLAYYQQRLNWMRGKAGTSRKQPGQAVTVRARQQWVKAESWRVKPHTCEHCGMPLTWAIMRIHHKQAASKGGEDSLENTEMLCANCHAEVDAEQRREWQHN